MAIQTEGYHCAIRAPIFPSPKPVSLRSVLQVFGYPYSVFIPFSRVSAFSMIHPQCITHPLYHLQLQRESGTYSGGVSNVVSKSTKHLLFFSYSLCKKWWVILVLYSLSTKSVCGDCRRYPDFHTDDEW